MTPPSTPALDALKNRTFEIDPGLAAQTNRQRRDLQTSHHQPTGAFLPPQVRDQQLRSGNERLGQQEGQLFREGQYDVNKLNYGRDLAVAGMSAPQLVQTGSAGTQAGTQSGTQSGTQQGTVVQHDAWGPMAGQMAASVAPLSL